jgi:hypothetical protein
LTICFPPNQMVQANHDPASDNSRPAASQPPH